MGSSNFQTKLLGLQSNLLNFAYLLTSNCTHRSMTTQYLGEKAG